jgi:hypothetical protein
MKWLLITWFALLTPISGNAQQGAVTFGNNASTPIRNYGTNASARVALYGSTRTDVTDESMLSQIGATANTFAPGLFSGGTRNIGLPGDMVTLQVRAWTGGFATYELALAAALGDPNVAIGCSSCWLQPVGGGTLPTQPITGADRFRGLSLDPFAGNICLVPEPSSVALACLGLALAVFRIRRR